MNYFQLVSTLVRLEKLFLLSLSLSLAMCNPPYHNERGYGNGGRRHHQEPVRCHEPQYGNGPYPSQPKDGPQFPANKPEVSLGSQLNPGYGEDAELKIFPSETADEQKAIQPDLPSPDDKLCPEGSGIYKPTGKCYRFSRHSEPPKESPCGSFMEFYQLPSNPSYGDCDCTEEIAGIPRPIAYHGPTDQCYWLFDQGPCKQDEWLDMDEKNNLSCLKRSCSENLPEDWSPNPNESSKKKFWFRYRGKCFQTGTQAYCENPRQKAYYEYTKESGYVLRCKEFAINVKTLLNGVKELPCAPGHKKTVSGECSRVVSFA